MPVLSTRVDPELREAVDRAAARTGMSRTDWLLSTTILGLVAAGELTNDEAAVRLVGRGHRNGNS